MVSLVRPEPVSATLVELDADQAAAVAHRGRLLRVLGGPGTGKTTVAVATAVDRVRTDGLAPDRCLLLAPTRVAAAALRDRVTAGVGGTSTVPLARTPSSYAFALLREAAALAGEPAPVLLSGPEQDVVLRDLLAGHAEGAGRDPGWPDAVRPALGTRGFRTELRDLLMRATEHGLGPADLAALGHAHDVPEWVAGATVLAEYDEVTALRSPGAHDPAMIIGAAADLLEEDPDALDRVRESLGLVVVDDAQDLTPAGVRLLRVLASTGVPVVLCGDPDAAVQTFRGGDPRWFARQWEELAGPAAGAQGVLFGLPGPSGGVLGDEPRTVVLRRGHRLPRALREADARVVGHIGVLGPLGQREATDTGPGGSVRSHVLRSTAQEAAFVAGELRSAHLRGGVPWSRMAVLVRGQGRSATLRRVLTASGVPVAAAAANLPVRDEPAARPLLLLFRETVRVALGEAEAYDPEVLTEVLLSVVGGADAVSLRRLRRELRRRELEGGGCRTADELLVHAAHFPLDLDGLGPEATPARRVGEMLAAGRAAARTVPGADGRLGWTPGVTAESVLWALWQASGHSGPWRAAALRGGSSGARRDRDLDAVVALFDAAGRFVDRLPGAGPDAFLAHLEEQDVAGDSLVARAPLDEAVEVLTPVAAAGREWDLVVLAGVQEGVWPDLRIRGSLLRSGHLVDVLTGRVSDWRGAQRAVRHDETRLLHVALTRARSRVVVTAVRSDDEQPSPYLDLVDPPAEASPGQEAGDGFTEVPAALSLPGVVATLRRDLVDRDPARRGAAVGSLARLARAGVPGADPSAWWALRTVTDDRPLRGPGAPVHVSPSKVADFTECGLRWLLRGRGGDGPPVGSAQVGTLVHEIAAQHPDDAPVTDLLAHLDREWPRLGLGRSWVDQRRRREAGEMVERLARYLSTASAEGWVRLAAEAGMRVALGRARVSGSVDRLEHHPDHGLRIVDLKTGSSRPTKDELARHPQLGAYQLALDHDGLDVDLAHLRGSRASAGAALLQLGKAANAKVAPDVQAPLARDADPGWAEALVTTTAEGMAGAAFTARPAESLGGHCTVCPVRSSCPAHPEGARL